MNKLDEITKELGTRYIDSKAAADALKTQREKFFEAIDEEILATETFAQKTIDVDPFMDDEELEDYIERMYPGWRLPTDPVVVEMGQAIIEEDPAYKKFVHVNPEDGKLYRRNVSQAGPSLDDDRLRREDPDLWKRITKPARVLKDLDKVSNKDLAAMQEYFVPGKMIAKLDAPRNAKPEELVEI